MSEERVLAADVPVLPAATVMLIRDMDATLGVAPGIEVFMLQRNHAASFARSQFVFPGGRVDDEDHARSFEPVCDGLDDAAASQVLGVDHGGLAWLVACIRECFEEAGILLARRLDEPDVVRFDHEEVAAHFESARLAIHQGERSLLDLCEADDLVLLTDRLLYVDHWVTPLGERKRFDTRFFLAAAPPAQVPLHDDRETIASVWVRPGDALDMWRGGELQMFPPTVASLRFLSRFGTVSHALGAAAALGRPSPTQPRLVIDGDGRMTGIRLPGDADYDDTPLPTYVVGNPR